MKACRFLMPAAVFMFLSTAAADNSRQSVKLEALPPAVHKTVLEQKQDAAILRLEKTLQDQKEIYELQLRDGQATKTVFIAASGAILQIKRSVPLSKLPPAARTSIETSVGDGKILSLESVQFPSGLIAAYEVRFQRSRAEHFLRISHHRSPVQE